MAREIIRDMHIDCKDRNEHSDSIILTLLL
jgi:hypothetical protein